MKRRLKVFVSSTFTDLVSEREAAVRAIRAVDLDTFQVETMPASENRFSEVVASAIDACDVFLGIYGTHYGHVLPELGISLTEFELVRAREAGKDILIYVKDDSLGSSDNALQRAFLRHAQAFEGGDLRRPRFRSAAELEVAIREDLEALLRRRFQTHELSDTGSLDEGYRSYIALLYGTVSFAGLARTSGKFGATLSELYVEPCLLSYSRHHVTDPKQRIWTEVAGSTRQWVLTGLPGCGKTVLLQKIALDYAQSGDLTPVLVPLSFAREQLTRDEADLESLLFAYIQHRFDPKFIPVIKRGLDTSSLIVLLDGFDEIESISQRESIGRKIASFCRRRPFLHLVLATRVSALSALPPNIPTFEIQPWSRSQIERFALSWSTAMTRDLSLTSDPRSQAQDFLHLIEANPAIRALAGSPLLITLLAFLHRQGFRIPMRRVEIYDIVARTLLSSWDMARSLSHTLDRGFSEAGMDLVLSALALEMTTRRISQIEREQAIHLIRDKVPTHQLKDSDIPKVLAMFVDRSGILIETSPSYYTFVHRSLQDYFAARAIASLQPQEARSFIIINFFDERFAEVVRLALSWLENHGQRGLVTEITEELANASRR